MITEKQKTANNEEISSLEKMIAEQRDRLGKLYEFDLDSALEYKCSESTVDDWESENEAVARYIIELQRHAKKVADHLADL